MANSHVRRDEPRPTRFDLRAHAALGEQVSLVRHADAAADIGSHPSSAKIQVDVGGDHEVVVQAGAQVLHLGLDAEPIGQI
jgi:hypothetical protein